MSYSFLVTADTKAEAKQRIADSFDNVVTNQPSHAADRDAAVAAGQAFIDTLVDPADGEEIHIAMHGSLGWKSQTMVPSEFISASVGVSAHIRTKQATN